MKGLYGEPTGPATSKSLETLLFPVELLLDLVDGQPQENRPAVRTGHRHGRAEEVVDDGAHARSVERMIGRDRGMTGGGSRQAVAEPIETLRPPPFQDLAEKLVD